MSKQKIALLFGGVSSEHEVSCMSATSVYNNIDRDKFELVLLGITKQGEWFRYYGDIANVRNHTWHTDTENLRRAFICPDRSVHGFMEENGPALYPHRVDLLRLHRTNQMCGASFVPHRIDVVYSVIHGQNGEDGSMQGLLEIAGIPYVGSRVLASAVGMDKDVCHAVLQNAGIPQVKWLTFRKGCNRKIAFAAVNSKMDYPLFVKPANAGSSVGITMVKSEDELDAAFDLAFGVDSKIIVEEGVKNPIEVECAVLGNHELVTGGPGEIVPADEFYSYDAKYYNAESKLYIPARIPEQTAELIRTMAKSAYHILGCRGLTRMDFLINRETGKLVLNEPNTLPGFTDISMYPKLMMSEGMTYSEIITKLIELAVEEFAEA